MLIYCFSSFTCKLEVFKCLKWNNTLIIKTLIIKSWIHCIDTTADNCIKYTVYFIISVYLYLQSVLFSLYRRIIKLNLYYTISMDLFTVCVIKVYALNNYWICKSKTYSTLSYLYGSMYSVYRRIKKLALYYAISLDLYTVCGIKVYELETDHKV